MGAPFDHLQQLLDIPGPEIMHFISFSTQLSLKFILLINVKMPTLVGILTFISRIYDGLMCFKPEISNDLAVSSLNFMLS